MKRNTSIQTYDNVHLKKHVLYVEKRSGLPAVLVVQHHGVLVLAVLLHAPGVGGPVGLALVLTFSWMKIMMEGYTYDIN